MASDIRDYPDKDGLEEWIDNNFYALRDSLSSAGIPKQSLENIKIDEIIIAGEHGRGVQRDVTEDLRIIISLNITVEDDEDELLEIADIVSDGFNDPDIRRKADGLLEMDGTMEEWFRGIHLTLTTSDNVSEGINLAVQVRDEGPNRAYSLTRREDIIVEEGGVITRGSIDEEEEVEEGIISEGEYASIIQYPDKKDILTRILAAYSDAVDEVKLEYESRREDIESLQVDRVVFTGAWGSGSAIIGSDSFDVTIFVSIPGKDTAPALFNRYARDLADAVVDNIEPSELMVEWSSGINLNLLHSNNTDTYIKSQIDDYETESAYDIMQDTLFRLVESDTVGFDVVREDIEPDEIEEAEQEEEEEVEGEEEPEDKDFIGPILPQDFEEEEPEEEKSKTRDEILAEMYPEMPPELRYYATDDDSIEVPLNSDSKKVNPRELYDFEREMSTPGSASTGIGRIQEGIGYSRLSDRYGYDDPPSSFPRTGAYIKYRLYHEGPSYALDMYRDIVVYSAYISTIYDARHVVGSYQSFREYLWRLKKIGKSEFGPRLIRELTSQEVDALGLSTMPKLPSGKPAPWLDRKKYYDIVEENIDHPAWNNPSEYLYGDGSE